MELIALHLYFISLCIRCVRTTSSGWCCSACSGCTGPWTSRPPPAPPRCSAPGTVCVLLTRSSCLKQSLLRSTYCGLLARFLNLKALVVIVKTVESFAALVHNSHLPSTRAGAGAGEPSYTNSIGERRTVLCRSLLNN